MSASSKVPHTYVIVFSIILFAAILTWVIPPGKYIKVDGRMEFKYKNELPEDRGFKSQPQTWQVFAALFKGFVKQSNIIIFIMMIGGAFWLMNMSKAIDVGIFAFLRFARKLENNPFMRKLGVNNVIMLLIMTMFSLFGSIFGMSEETIAFAIILIPLAISMGYDSIVGVSLVYLAAHFGFAGAMLNPFTIGIAQGLADIPLFSGIEYRIFCWLIINAVGFWFVLNYAKKVKRNPTISPVYEEDHYWRKHLEINHEEIKYHTPVQAWWVYGAILLILSGFSWYHPFTTISIGEAKATFYVLPSLSIIFALTGYLTLRRSVHYFILLLLTYTIIFLIVGVMGYEWYVMEIATLFMALGIASGVSIGLHANNIATSFLDGVKDILSAALVVGLAGGIIVILEDGGVIDTILYGLSKSMSNFGKLASVSTMYAIQTIINIVIPSGSAKAAITMPIMAPFSDLIGVSRQATVMAFQFGDGFTNMITPTSGVLIAVLGVARIPYQKWLNWVWPLILMLVLLGFLLLIPTVTMELRGF